MRCCCRCCCTWISNKRRTFSVASFPIKVKTIITRSTGTVPTSAKARLTSAAVRRISIHEWMSVNHLPCLPIMTNPENYPRIQTVVRIATKIESVVQRPIANLPWKFHANPFTSGAIIAELVNVVQTRHKVIPINLLGEAIASRRRRQFQAGLRGDVGL